MRGAQACRETTGCALLALAAFVLCAAAFCCHEAHACPVVADSDPTATWDASDGAIYYAVYQELTGTDLPLGWTLARRMDLSRRMVWQAGQDVTIYVTAINWHGESAPSTAVCFSAPVICDVNAGYTNETPPMRCTARLP